MYENDKAYQKHAYLINTCGRHCVNFIEFFKNFNFDLFDYYKAMKELKTNLKIPSTTKKIPLIKCFTNRKFHSFQLNNLDFEE